MENPNECLSLGRTGIYAFPGERKLWKAAAKKDFRSVSSWIRELANTRARKICPELANELLGSEIADNEEGRNAA